MNNEICKARMLFHKKGIVNRNIIRNDISYSWVRSKFFDVDYEINFEKHIENKDLFSFDEFDKNIIKYIREYYNKTSNIILSDMEGNIIYSKLSTICPFNLHSLNEQIVGTTSFSLSVNSKKNETVSGCEHYIKKLMNFISSTIVLFKEDKNEFIFLTIISSLELFNEHNILLEKFSVLDSYNKEDKNLFDYIIKEDEKEEKKNNNRKINKKFDLKHIEKKTIISALEHYKFNMSKAAINLGISRSTLYRKIKEHNIETKKS